MIIDMRNIIAIGRYQLAIANKIPPNNGLFLSMRYIPNKIKNIKQRMKGLKTTN